MKYLFWLCSTGYIAWHGRYRAYDYAGFSAFMQHTFSEVLNVPSPAYGYDAFKNDLTLDEEAIGKKMFQSLNGGIVNVMFIFQL